jgi:hypothetical protein
VSLCALLAYDYPFGQWVVACVWADPLAPVESPGLFAEKGGFAPCGLSAWLAKAGCPTACVLAEHSSPGTSGSLTARAAEPIVPSNNAEVRATATILVVLFNPRPPFAAVPLPFKECVRIVKATGLLPCKRAGSPQDPGPGCERCAYSTASLGNSSSRHSSPHATQRHFGASGQTTRPDSATLPARDSSTSCGEGIP